MKKKERDREKEFLSHSLARQSKEKGIG